MVTETGMAIAREEMVSEREEEVSVLLIRDNFFDISCSATINLVA